jgi:hypothetical protein
MRAAPDCARFCSICGAMLQEAWVHQNEPSEFKFAPQYDSASSQSDEGYASDEDTFFSRREAYYTSCQTLGSSLG